MPHCPAEAARCSETDPAPAPNILVGQDAATTLATGIAHRHGHWSQPRPVNFRGGDLSTIGHVRRQSGHRDAVGRKRRFRLIEGGARQIEDDRLHAILALLKGRVAVYYRWS